MPNETVTVPGGPAPAPHYSPAVVATGSRTLSISGQIANAEDGSVVGDDAYEQAHRRALALLDQGLPLGGRIESTRDEWHER